MDEQAIVNSLLAKIESQLNTGQKSYDKSPCESRFRHIEEQLDGNTRAIRGNNGDPGMAGLIRIVESRLQSLEDSHKELQKTLIGLGVAVFLTLIGTIINLVVK